MKKPVLVVLALVALFGTTLAAVWLLDSIVISKPHGGPQTDTRSRAEIIEACNAHVREAESEARAAIDRRAVEFVSFIEGRKAGAATFAQDTVSLYGKWRTVKPYLPFTDTDGHNRYVEEQFSEHIFSREDLAGTTKLVVTESVKDLEAIENRLAVRVRAEISAQPVGMIDISSSTNEFADAIKRVKAASQWDTTKAGASLAVSEVAAIVGTQVLVRLGVSAGLLTAGAANSWWTFGAGIVIGLMADVVWGWIDDPAEDIERHTVAELDRLAIRGADALRAELGMIVTERSKLWKKAVEDVVP